MDALYVHDARMRAALGLFQVLEGQSFAALSEVTEQGGTRSSGASEEAGWVAINKCSTDWLWNLGKVQTGSGIWGRCRLVLESDESMRCMSRGEGRGTGG